MYCSASESITLLIGQTSIEGLPRWLSELRNCNAGNSCSIPGLGRSSRGGRGHTGGHSAILAWRISWWAIVHRVAKSQTQLK